MKLVHLTAPWFFRRGGCGDFIRYLEETERNQWKSPEEIHEIQWEKTKQILLHASRKVPYYRSLFQRTGLDPQLTKREEFSRIPLLTKEIIRDNEDAFFSEGTVKEKLVLKQSSGSTGVPTKIYLDHDRAMHSWAYNLRHNRWAGLDWGCRVGSLWGGPDHQPPEAKLQGRSLREIMIDYLAGNIREVYLNPFHHSEAEIDHFIRKLRVFRPQILLGYSNSLYFLAQYFRDNRVKGIHPRGIICGGETLLPEARELLQQVFCCKVFLRYGTREADIIASECEEGRLHLNDDNLLIEVHGEPGDSQGSVLMTDLNNRVMPLIRYDLGDIAELDSRKCPCGRGLSVLKSIQGRKSELFKTRDGRRISGLWFNKLARSIQSVRKYQLRQKDYEHFEVLLAVDSPPSQAEIDHFRQEIQGVFGESCVINIQYVDDIPKAGSGKFHFLISDVE